jgi:hypothetical protein
MDHRQVKYCNMEKQIITNIVKHATGNMLSFQY